VRAGEADHARDARGLQGFGQAHRRQNGGEATRQHPSEVLTIACTAHATGTDAVRECTLDTAASCLLGLKRWRGLALPIRHQRLVLLLGPDGQGAPDISGALGSMPAITAIAGRKLDFNDVIIAVINIVVINRRGPAEARVSCGASHLLPLPVDPKAAEVKGALRMSLPAHAASPRPTDVDGIVALADREPFGIDIVSINDMALRRRPIVSRVA
jgi:hypothetical protein